MSKLLERILLDRMCAYIKTTEFMFGFKKGHSTDMCIYALKETISYYRSLGSTVFLCFADIKSAYDRVDYNRLFLGLLKRGVPRYIIQLLKTWYAFQRIYVKWGEKLSNAFYMTNGIRQGSILSPYLFNMYINGLSKSLSTAKVGCHIAGKAVNHLIYADDIVLLAPSAKALNTLLNICSSFADENKIIFSPTKSVCMRIPPRKDENALRSPPNIFLSGSRLQYVCSYKYLGCYIDENFDDNMDIGREVKSMYSRGNNLIRKLGFLPFDVKRSLFMSYCYPMYGSALWSNFTKAKLYRLEVAYNNIMRKIAYVAPWQSARRMFVTCQVKSFQENLRAIMYSLMNRVDTSANEVLVLIRDSDLVNTSSIRDSWRKSLFADRKMPIILMSSF